MTREEDISDDRIVLAIHNGFDVRVLSGAHAPRMVFRSIWRCQCLQRASNTALAHVECYDDIYIFTKSPRIEDYLDALRETLDVLRENKLYVKLSKCVFCAEEIPCLGHFVGRNGVRMDLDKVQTIKVWSVPRTQERLHNFPGLTEYVQRSCPDYATLTSSVFALLKKKNKRNAKVHFNDELLKNIKELKRRLCNTPVLHLPDFGQSMHLRTDASKFAVGGVLFQVMKGVERPIAYTSRKMKPAELNYPTQQQERLAIVNALAAFRIYCLDKPPIVETDHKILEGLFTQKMANRRLARWYDILAEYQPTFSYISCAKNGIADGLSRRPDLQPDAKFFHDLTITSFNDTSFSLAISDVVMNSDIISESRQQGSRTAIKQRSATLKPKERKQHLKLYRCYFEAHGLLQYQSPADDNPPNGCPQLCEVETTDHW
ncbi:Reverse transcriptase [Phytophthora palmivora]|uniref:Reverse transcriptase n=1 Tax=Phytophthora palmivora TaxID=4796 RepID=A0A2P4XVK2_9STRA|nr:Reverse transcriptase [Phytophthora palmivora]